LRLHARLRALRQNRPAGFVVGIASAPDHRLTGVLHAVALTAIAKRDRLEDDPMAHRVRRATGNFAPTVCLKLVGHGLSDSEYRRNPLG